MNAKVLEEIQGKTRVRVFPKKRREVRVWEKP
jgi:hypothetical protein